MRIVSLLPSATEVVCALGLERQLVGRSHECDYPEEVQTLPVCSEPRFNPMGTSREIDDRVQAIVQKALSVYQVHVEQLKTLRPDVILTQDHCDVCAVGLPDVERAVCEIVDSKPRIVTLKPTGLPEVWKGMKRVAEALGCSDKGALLVSRIQRRMEEISEKARRLSKSPSVLLIEWFDPLMAAANWMPEFVEMLGGKDVFGASGSRAVKIRWEDVRDKDPDLIVILPCGWGIQRSLQEIKTLTQKLGWVDLKAVCDARVYVADGSHYFNRPGPRLMESFEMLAEMMYPDTFRFGHEGSGWKKLTP